MSDKIGTKGSLVAAIEGIDGISGLLADRIVRSIFMSEAAERFLVYMAELDAERPGGAGHSSGGGR